MERRKRDRDNTEKRKIERAHSRAGLLPFRVAHIRKLVGGQLGNKDLKESWCGCVAIPPPPQDSFFIAELKPADPTTPKLAQK